MSYEPRGKVKTLIEAMDADPAREWTAADAAEVMRTTHGGVHAFIARAIEAKVLYRSLNNGRTVLSRKPFTEVSCVSRLPAVPTTATGWRPPSMGTPRGTPAPTSSPARSHDTVDGLPPGAPRIYPDEPREDAIAKMAAAGVAREPVPGQRFVPALAKTVEVAAAVAAAPQITPVPPVEAAEPALTIELDGPLDDQQQEEAEPVTWNIWEDGDLDLHGLIELEGGGHRLPAEAVRRLRKFIAWMPAC